MSSRSFAFKSTALLLMTVLPSASVLAASSSKTVSIIEQNYPAESLAKGEQGLVAFAVDLDAAANIDSCVVTKSSGYPRLDAATCDVIVKHAHFSPAESDGKRVATTRTGQMAWKLPKSYAANARFAGPPVPQTREQLEEQRLLCEKSDRVGSIVKKVVFCLTKTEWATGRKLTQESLTSTAGGMHGCHLRAGFGCN